MSSSLGDVPPVAPTVDPFVRGLNIITPLEGGRIRVVKYVRKPVDSYAQPIWKSVPTSSFILFGTAMLVVGRRIRRRSLVRVPA